jgi:hypothetical protein
VLIVIHSTGLRSQLSWDRSPPNPLEERDQKTKDKANVNLK